MGPDVVKLKDKMLLYLNIGALYICLMVGVYHREKLTNSQKYIIWLLICTAITESIGMYNLLFLKKVYYPIFHIYQPIEYTLLALYFKSIIDLKPWKTIIKLTIPLMIALNLINSIWIQKINELPTYPFLITAILVSGWTIVYYYQTMIQESEIQLIKNSDFWISTGILFFYLGAFFVMGFINIISQKNTEIAIQLYNINHFLNIVMYTTFTFSFICQVRYQKL